MAPSLPYLPTELKLQIIKEAVTFPDGLRSDRWHLEQRDHVNKFFLLSHELSVLVPASLYKNNKVVIKPQPTQHNGTTLDGPELPSYGYLAPFPGTPPSNIRPYITYPTIAQSQSVQELEFHFDLVSAGFNPTFYLYDQLGWLRKLASRELGFPVLRSLRIVFNYGQNMYGLRNIIWQVCQQTHSLFHFSTTGLEILINGHSCCRDSCPHELRCALHGDELCGDSCEPTVVNNCELGWNLSDLFKASPPTN